MTGRVLLLLSLTLLGPGGLAHAGAVNLRWNQCWGDGGAINKNFACDTNLGSHVLVASFVSPYAPFDAMRLESVLDIAVASQVLPAWWHVDADPSSCRRLALSTSIAIPATAVNCADWASGQGVGPFVTLAVDDFAPYRLRLRLSTSTPFGVLTGIVQGQEYFAYQLSLRNLKTVGADACSGCGLGACIGLKSIGLVLPDDGGTMFLAPGFSPGVPGSVDDAVATWQGGGDLLRPRLHHTTDCPAATPVRNSTWGAVKGMYR